MNSDGLDKFYADTNQLSKQIVYANLDTGHKRMRTPRSECNKDQKSCSVHRILNKGLDNVGTPRRI